MSYGALSATGLAANQVGFGPLVGDVAHVAHDSLEELEDYLMHRGDQLAAIIAEPVMGAGGVIPPAPGYLQALRECCDAYGAFLILDEVICGFGRLGSWWGAERYGVRPDLIAFAKGVTSGYAPLGGVLVGPAVRAPLEADRDFLLRHGHTYSGHPSACAAALANIDVIANDGLAARAPAIGARLSAGLKSAVDDHRVVAVRGDGAVWAAVLAEGVKAAAVRDAMLEAGVITRSLGDDVVAFCPPLVISDADVTRCAEVFADAVDAVALAR
jgi:adenosylmethionine-8-amino-7-oxononanoate aminotransferase